VLKLAAKGVVTLLVGLLIVNNDFAGKIEFELPY
jgi:hypothetical protein